jgi:MFS family permease
MGMVTSTLGLLLEQRVGSAWAGPGSAVGVVTLTGALLAGRWVSEMAAPVLGGLSDRLGRRPAAVGFLLLGGALLAAAARAVGVVPLALLVLLFFVCATGANVVLAAEAGLRGGRSVAAYVSAVDLGAASGPILGWTIQQWSLPPAWILWLGSAAYLGSGLVAGCCLRQRGAACPPAEPGLP